MGNVYHMTQGDLLNLIEEGSFEHMSDESTLWFDKVHKKVVICPEDQDWVADNPDEYLMAFPFTVKAARKAMGQLFS